MSGANLVLLFIFTALGFVVTGWWNNHSAYVARQEAELQRFVNMGLRFTAQQGQELCEVVRVVAMHSIGFQQSGLPLPDCEKYLKAHAPTPLREMP